MDQEPEQTWTPALTLCSSAVWCIPPVQGVLAKADEPQQPQQSVSSCEHWQKEINSARRSWTGPKVRRCETQAGSPFPGEPAQVSAGSKTRTRGCAGPSRSSSFAACIRQSVRHPPAQPTSPQEPAVSSFTEVELCPPSPPLAAFRRG